MYDGMNFIGMAPHHVNNVVISTYTSDEITKKLNNMFDNGKSLVDDTQNQLIVDQLKTNPCDSKDIVVMYVTPVELLHYNTSMTVDDFWSINVKVGSPGLLFNTMPCHRIEVDLNDKNWYSNLCVSMGAISFTSMSGSPIANLGRDEIIRTCAIGNIQTLHCRMLTDKTKSVVKDTHNDILLIDLTKPIENKKQNTNDTCKKYTIPGYLCSDKESMFLNSITEIFNNIKKKIGGMISTRIWDNNRDILREYIHTEDFVIDAITLIHNTMDTGTHINEYTGNFDVLQRLYLGFNEKQNSSRLRCLLYERLCQPLNFVLQYLHTPLTSFISWIQAKHKYEEVEDVLTFDEFNEFCADIVSLTIESQLSWLYKFNGETIDVLKHLSDVKQLSHTIETISPIRDKGDMVGLFHTVYENVIIETITKYTNAVDGFNKDGSIKSKTLVPQSYYYNLSKKDNDFIKKIDLGLSYTHGVFTSTKSNILDICTLYESLDQGFALTMNFKLPNKFFEAGESVIHNFTTIKKKFESYLSMQQELHKNESTIQDSMYVMWIGDEIKCDEISIYDKEKKRSFNVLNIDNINEAIDGMTNFVKLNDDISIEPYRNVLFSTERKETFNTLEFRVDCGCTCKNGLVTKKRVLAVIV
jgi:hypothetical protein